MKTSILILAFATIIIHQNLAQNINWADDVATIFYENCSDCHHTDGLAPFNLMDYEDVVLYAEDIHEVIEHRIMPPWPADPNYRHFLNEKILSQNDIDIIHQWMEDGMPIGNILDIPPPPEFQPNGSFLENIDLTLSIPPYTLQSNDDEYRWFVFPTNFPEPVYINKVEVLSGLDLVVHHADLFLDNSDISLNNDLADPLPGFSQNFGIANSDKYINAWQPGAAIATYPENWGIEIPPGGNLVIEIHYGPGGIGQIDSTRMNLQFLSNQENVRVVNAAWLLHDSEPVMQDGPLIIPANEIVTFHQERTLNNPISIISICPHMHFLGKSYKVWAITPDNSYIPLIDIPHWDFHWQRYYTYPILQTLPTGTTIFSEASYDNTIDNHDNPNNPPITVYRGLRTEDEMFLCYFIYADYQPGDELISMDPGNIVGTTVEINENLSLKVFPNPAKDKLNLDFPNNTDQTISIDVYDITGKHVFQQHIDNAQLDISNLNSGLYYLKWQIGKRSGSTSFYK